MLGLIVEQVVLFGFFVSYVVLVFCEVIVDMCVCVGEILVMIGVLFLCDCVYVELFVGEICCVLIVCVLVNWLQVLLLDEFFIGLDLVVCEQLVVMMWVLVQQGIILVLVIYYIEEIIFEIECVVLLCDGCVLVDGICVELLCNELLLVVFGGVIIVCEQEGRLIVYVG